MVAKKNNKTKDNSKSARPTKKNLSRSSWFQAFGAIPPFAHLVFIFILLIVLFLLFTISNNNVSPLYKEAKKEASKKTYTLKHNVFGDHFVNNLTIDASRTNFYLDITTTSFIFNPLYNWVDKGSCQDKYCGFEAIDWHYAGVEKEGEVEYCLEAGCFMVSNNKLFLDDNEINLPESLNSYPIKNISIYPLSSTWLVGFVYEDGNREKGQAYSFDGSRYTDLDPEKRFNFISRENFNGASFGFGGSDDNYLVIYGGYDFSVYQITKGKKVDISRFFGLRVSGGGFSPIALKEEIEGETTWYVCSLTENKPSLIKLWQNGSDSVKGSLTLSETLLENREDAKSAWCRLGDKSGELEVVINRGRSYYKKIFQDNGFEQKNNYQLVSKNLLTAKGFVNQARFNGLIACDDTDCSNNVLSRSIEFSVSGDSKNYFPAELNKSILFPENSPGLYWQMETEGRKNNKYYSPWIDGLIDISYSWWE